MARTSRGTERIRTVAGVLVGAIVTLADVGIFVYQRLVGQPESWIELTGHGVVLLVGLTLMFPPVGLRIAGWVRDTIPFFDRRRNRRGG